MVSVHDMIFSLEDIFTLSILMHQNSPNQIHVTNLGVALFMLFLSLNK